MSKRSLERLEGAGSRFSGDIGNSDGNEVCGESDSSPKVVGLDKVTGKTIGTAVRNCESEDFFGLEDLEIWSLLPDAVSVVENSLLGELSVDSPGRR